MGLSRTALLDRLGNKLGMISVRPGDRVNRCRSAYSPRRRGVEPATATARFFGEREE